MSHVPNSATYTTDFRQEFEAETESLLRRRFMWFSGLLAGMGLLIWLTSLAVSLLGSEIAAQMGSPGEPAVPVWQRVTGLSLGLINTGIACACFFAVRRRPMRRDDLLRASYLLVTADGLFRVLLSWLDISGSLGLVGVMLSHTLACAFLPWSPRQAVLPLIPVVSVFAVLHLLPNGLGDPQAWIAVMFSPFIAGPGVLVCWLRDTRRLAQFKLRFFQNRYGEVRRELVDARRIHESLFPRPISDGPVRLAYQYEPMRQIGGDYLYAHRLQQNDDSLGCLNIVLLDVTGHGISAALTVNRLYGELARIFAEQPTVRPGEVLRLLNKYIHLTLADHSVYVTGLCVRANLDADSLEYASGGHPPAFVRAVDGTLHELDSTALVLGACADVDFAPEPRSVRFGPGDTLLAYTDGAIESRGIDGVMLGLSGLRKFLAGAKAGHGEWPDLLLRTVTGYRLGPPADDTLLVELSRPIETAPAPRRPSRASGLFRAGPRPTV